MSKELLIEHINTPEMLGVAVKRLRKNSGLSQDQVAKLVNIRQATVSDLENGRGTLESLFKVIQALKLNLALSNKSTLNTERVESRAKEVLNLLKN